MSDDREYLPNEDSWPPPVQIDPEAGRPEVSGVFRPVDARPPFWKVVIVALPLVAAAVVLGLVLTHVHSSDEREAVCEPPEIAHCE